jgi:hypothetical protein
VEDVSEAGQQFSEGQGLSEAVRGDAAQVRRLTPGRRPGCGGPGVCPGPVPVAGCCRLRRHGPRYSAASCTAQVERSASSGRTSCTDCQTPWLVWDAITVEV